ncbi:hypothetical protein VT84_07475 [Gemmata sp. SH-PL17]|uniref:HNH endonuclease n=1 Tax=Gemmata sp. SH-PL17 TaxID=1630693 RepID=UPI00078B52EC|nr:HNH endonuclease [Gemmata sp. SH-PL17]AMV24221.1 hypothetical protein VT84_07475 [Gemmata sp. SH-PL17]
MPRLTEPVLYTRLEAALPPGSTIQSVANTTRPILATVPSVGQFRIYLWTLTRDRSRAGSRPRDEFKIQLILPGQQSGSSANFDFTPPHVTVILGFSPEFGVFGAWEPQLHPNFRYSKGCYIKEWQLEEARDTGWAVSPARALRRSTPEVRVAFSPGNLGAYLTAARDAESQSLSQGPREAFFLARTPNLTIPAPPSSQTQLPAYTARVRRRIAATRVSRDPRFSGLVGLQYGHACAVCGCQLGIVEGAHIIPVREAGSTDDIWNGIALCPNHHRLFDANLLLIRPGLEIEFDDVRLTNLRRSGLAGGEAQWIDPHRGQSIQTPAFFNIDATATASMVNALATRQARIGA